MDYKKLIKHDVCYLTDNIVAYKKNSAPIKIMVLDGTKLIYKGKNKFNHYDCLFADNFGNILSIDPYDVERAMKKVHEIKVPPLEAPKTKTK